MTEALWAQGPKKGHKTRYRRKKACIEYLSIAKQKKTKAAKMRKVIRNRLACFERNLEDIGKLLITTGLEALRERDLTRLVTICEFYRQQQAMTSAKATNAIIPS